MDLKRRDFLKGMGAGTAGLMLSSCQSLSRLSESSESSAERPNILLILSDDQGYAQSQAYSDTYTVKSVPPERRKGYKKSQIDACIEAANSCMPNIDGLAREGMRMLDAHTAPTCAPSRTCLMTSRYPQRRGIFCNLDINGPGVSPREFFLPILLQRSGYDTALVGKWHMGLARGQHPLDRGFDHFFGFDGWKGPKYNCDKLYLGRQRTPAKGFLTDQLSDHAVSYLQNRENDNPFFMYLCYANPHTPRPEPPSKYQGRFDTGSEYNDTYYDYLYAMDQGIGRVLKALEESGEAENTIVIYATDNGGDWNAGHHQAPFPGNGIYKAGKRTLWEGGIRVPLIMRWPAKIEPGTDFNEFFHFMDIMPTLLAAADVKIPSSLQLDGKNALPHILGQKDGPIHDEAVFWASEQHRVTDEWQQDYKEWQKLDAEEKKHPGWLFAYLPAAYTARKGKWKMINPGTGEPELYDLENDPSETTDLTEQRPEILKELVNEYAEWLSQMPKPVEWYEDKWEALQPPDL